MTHRSVSIRHLYIWHTVCAALLIAETGLLYVIFFTSAAANDCPGSQKAFTELGFPDYIPGNPRVGDSDLELYAAVYRLPLLKIIEGDFRLTVRRNLWAAASRNARGTEDNSSPSLAGTFYHNGSPRFFPCGHVDSGQMIYAHITSGK
jgi:hypothetical protein